MATFIQPNKNGENTTAARSIINIGKIDTIIASLLRSLDTNTHGIIALKNETMAIKYSRYELIRIATSWDAEFVAKKAKNNAKTKIVKLVKLDRMRSNTFLKRIFVTSYATKISVMISSSI